MSVCVGVLPPWVSLAAKPSLSALEHRDRHSPWLHLSCATLGKSDSRHTSLHTRSVLGTCRWTLLHYWTEEKFLSLQTGHVSFLTHSLSPSHTLVSLNGSNFIVKRQCTPRECRKATCTCFSVFFFGRARTLGCLRKRASV